MKPLFWNHNSAYYHWVDRQIGQQAVVLDVGCGDGTLVRMLQSANRTVVGLDPAIPCTEQTAGFPVRGASVPLIRTTFEQYDRSPESMDAVIFVASLHHMDMEMALRKAKWLLRPKGKLIVIGLAAPSSVVDWCFEVLRVIPCKIISCLHKEQPPETLGITTSSNVPSMAQIRSIVRKMLPGAKLRQGLYYRYLLTWEK